MKNIIADLKLEHKALKTQMAVIKQHGIMTPEGFSELMHFKGILLAHLEHEDRDVYSILEQPEFYNDGVITMLANFREEMREITAEVVQFFGLYESPTESVDFVRDLSRIFNRLLNRIMTEEFVLYPRLQVEKRTIPGE